MGRIRIIRLAIVSLTYYCVHNNNPMSLSRKIILSVVNVTVLLFMTYVMNNQPLFTGEDLINLLGWSY